MGYKKSTEEFKREVLTLVAEGSRSVAQREQELDIIPDLTYKWQKRYRLRDEKLEPSEVRADQAELRRLKRRSSRRAEENAVLAACIRAVDEESPQNYGYLRVYAQLRTSGEQVGKHRVA